MTAGVLASAVAVSGPVVQVVKYNALVTFYVISLPQAKFYNFFRQSLPSLIALSF